MAPGGSVGSSAQVSRKCIVIMEGNPHPGAVKGRMSFQNFNPSIDKLNEEARDDHETESSSPSNYHQDSANSRRLVISLLSDLGNFICQNIFSFKRALFYCLCVEQLT
uniref:Uncharacterized protein n=1 Tax=Arundo donax TaxID=35708 RepID=A0A0A9D2I2_ARUDO